MEVGREEPLKSLREENENMGKGEEKSLQYQQSLIWILGIATANETFFFFSPHLVVKWQILVG